MLTKTTTISPVSPYNFELTAGFGALYPAIYTQDCEPAPTYQRLLNVNDTIVLSSVRSIGNTEHPKLSLELTGTELNIENITEAVSQIKWVLGCDQDLSQFYRMTSNDHFFNRIIASQHGLHVPMRGSIFESFVLAILGQQISNNIANSIRKTFIETYGLKRVIKGSPFYCFPTPETITGTNIESLMKLKLSRRKAEYLIGIAQLALDNDSILNPEPHLNDDEIIKHYMTIRGVGEWTAHWALSNGKGSLDSFPSGDLALRKIISNQYFDGKLQTEEVIKNFARTWSPWRTYATTYLFGAIRKSLV